ncbi:MAG: hypothetical protein CVU29_11825 [Betaproteobacteria bacterium HGW-Betaproteobacteria-22]|nr:MAG: hypothetical protein CVU29_11825 [Betaproteobacteria bacterium HGW-Betaproteobacteria-22]
MPLKAQFRALQPESSDISFIDVWLAATEKTNAVFRRGLTRDAMLSVVAVAKKPRNAAILPRSYAFSVP